MKMGGGGGGRGEVGAGSSCCEHRISKFACFPHTRPKCPRARSTRDMYLLKLHRIHQSPNPLNLYYHLIPMFQIPGRLKPKPHPTWGPRHDQRPLLQRLPRTQKRHQLSHPKTQVRRVSFLPHLSIHKHLHPQPGAIPQFPLGYQTRAERGVLVEGFGKRPLWCGSGFVFLHLPRSTADVVSRRVSRDVIEGAVGGHVLAVTPNDQSEFAFIVTRVLGKTWDGDGAARVGDRLTRFEEDGGVFGKVEAGF